MFVEPAWQESIVALLVAINTLAGAGDRNVVAKPLSIGDVAAIAQALKNNSYQPDQWFVRGTMKQQPVAQAAPPVAMADRYDVMVLGIEPSGLAEVSKKSGGLVYEDPFYALLASYNIGRYKSNLVNVQVSSRDHAWAQRQRIVDQLRQGVYRPEKYFALAGPAIPGTNGADLRAASLAGEALSRLAFNGETEARLDGEPAKLFGLYKYVAP
jgi:hypothetical protein